MGLPLRVLKSGYWLLAGLIAWLVWAPLHQVPPSDPLALVTGAQQLAKCIPNWTFPCAGVTQFPLFQQAPAVVMNWLGLNINQSLQAFSVLGAIGVALTILVPTVVVIKRSGIGVGAMMAVLLIPTPLLYYAGTPWGEPVAVLLNLSIVLCFVFRLPAVWLFFAAAAAGIAKEVSFPTIVLVGGACAVAVYGHDRKKLLWFATALVAGAIVGQALDSLLNLARYGTLTNVVYDSVAAVPGVGLRLQLAVGIWLAPGGGVVPYWPTYLIAVALLAVGAWRGWRTGTWLGLAPTGLLLAALTINTGILASWYAPFGWIAWGPRLMIPWLPAIAVAAVVVAPDAARACAHALFSRPLAALAVAVVAVFGVVVNVAARITEAWTGFFDTATPACPRPAGIGQPHYYYSCLTHSMWMGHGSEIGRVLTAAKPTEPWLLLLSAMMIAFVAFAYVHTAKPDLGRLTRYLRGLRHAR